MVFKVAAGLLLAAVMVGALLAPAQSASKKRYVTHSYSYLPPPAYGDRKDGRAHSPNPSQDVYLHGKYSGSDPDPFIRGSLARDPPWNSTR
jgi:hypothetical protein